MSLDRIPGAKPGFLERGIIYTCIKVWGICFADFISHENEIIWSHRIFKNGGREGGFV